MRLPGWRSSLYRYFDDIRAKPFDKDNHNCAHFAADGFLIITGNDPFKKYRRCKYFESQLKAIRRDGYANHVELFASILPEVHPMHAKVGDLVVFPTDDALEYALGFVVGEFAQVLRPEGLGLIAVSNAIKAFEIT